MTAEVAILNKSAIALAADSAVSIGAPSNLKIYNTVNKIFELSTKHPVGIMIYGRMDFMGLPLETIIKSYRKRLGDKSFNTIAEYKLDFQNYLSTEVPISQDDEARNIYLLTWSTFSKMNAAIDDLVLQDISSRGSFKKSKVNSLAQKYISEKIKLLKARSFATGYSRKAIPTQYVAYIDAMMAKCFQSNFPTDGTKKLIRDFAGYCLSKQTLSDYRTGIVVAGFGENDLCPSLAQFLKLME